MIRRKILTFIICILQISIFLTPTNANAFKNETVLDINSEAVILIDADSKRIIYAKNENEKLYPASTTKVMTMLLALEYGNLNDTITMSKEAIDSIEYGSSNIALFENEQITLKQALHAASISSANEACNGIAEYISGSMDEFAKLMTSKAKEIGALNTNFVNANGLHDDNHYTTAYDLALIMAYAINVENYIDITSVQEFNIDPTNIQTETRYLHGTNKTMIEGSDYYVEGAVTSKTGYTSNSQQTQVTYASRNGVNLIAVVMKSDSSNDRFADTKTLLEYGFDNFEIFDTTTLEYSIPEVTIGDNIITDELVEPLFKLDTELQNVLIDKGASDSIRVEVNMPSTIEQSYQEGSRVGSLKLYYDDELIQTIKIVTTQSITTQLKSVVNKLKILLLFTMFVILFLLLIVVIAKRYYYFKKKRRKQLLKIKKRERQLHIEAYKAYHKTTQFYK